MQTTSLWTPSLVVMSIFSFGIELFAAEPLCKGHHWGGGFCQIWDMTTSRISLHPLLPPSSLSLLSDIEPPALMLRLDAASLFAPPPDPSPSHTFSLELHDLLFDDLRLPSWDEPFPCLSVSNLPRGSGVGVADAASLKYDHQLKVSMVVWVWSAGCVGVVCC